MTEIDITGYDPPVIGYVSGLPWRRAQTDFGINNSWTKIHGNHTIKWGVDIDRERTDLRQAGPPRGAFSFTPGPAALSGDSASSNGMANAFAAFLLDLPNSFNRALSPFFPTRRDSWLFFYGTDKWQVSRKGYAGGTPACGGRSGQRPILVSKVNSWTTIPTPTVFWSAATATRPRIWESTLICEPGRRDSAWRTASMKRR